MHSLSHGQSLLPCNQECSTAFSRVQTAMRRRLRFGGCWPKYNIAHGGKPGPAITGALRKRNICLRPTGNQDRQRWCVVRTLAARPTPVPASLRHCRRDSRCRIAGCAPPSPASAAKRKIPCNSSSAPRGMPEVGCLLLERSDTGQGYYGVRLSRRSFGVVPDSGR
jgi:hypothetical protein